MKKIYKTSTVNCTVDSKVLYDKTNTHAQTLRKNVHYKGHEMKTYAPTILTEPSLCGLPKHVTRPARS